VKWPGFQPPPTPPAPLLSPIAYYTLLAVEREEIPVTVHEIWKGVIQVAQERKEGRYAFTPHGVYQCLLRGEVWDPPLYRRAGFVRSLEKGRPPVLWELSVECRALREKMRRK
jgi:hypothetical protein